MLPGGLPAWTGPAEPGHVHDITAACRHALPALYRAAALGMPALADGGCEGAGIGIRVPVKNPGGNQWLAPDTKTRNSLLDLIESNEPAEPLARSGTAMAARPLLTAGVSLLLAGRASAGARPGRK